MKISFKKAADRNLGMYVPNSLQRTQQRHPREQWGLKTKKSEKLRKAEEKTGFSLARLINLLVEEGYLDELVVKHRKVSLRSAF